MYNVFLGFIQQVSLCDALQWIAFFKSATSPELLLIHLVKKTVELSELTKYVLYLLESNCQLSLP